MWRSALMRRFRSVPLAWKMRSVPSRTSIFLALLGFTAFIFWAQNQISPTSTVARLQAEPSTIRTSSTQKPDTSQVKPSDIYNQVRIDTPPQVGTKIPTQSVPSVTTLEKPLRNPNAQATTGPSPQLATTIPTPPVTSVLHPNTPEQLPLNPNVAFDIKSVNNLFHEYQELFPQYGKKEPGMHYRIENTRLLTQPGIRESDSVLILCVFNDANSWGENRTIIDFFNLVGSFNYQKEKISIALLTSSLEEFNKVKDLYQSYILQYPRLSLIFRDDFVQNGLTRDNRHEVQLQANRRRMIARYRNYALMLTMETWHQHVVWIDADVKVIPSHLLRKMALSGLDILTPICYSNFRGRWINYDQNAWVGQRIVRPADQSDKAFMPGPLKVKLLDQVDDKSKPYAPLDSVGATMLYVRADVHRQGVMFPMHYVIGSEWGREGYDGIETEGLCYSAHFLGFKCWGMVNESIQHTDEV